MTRITLLKPEQSHDCGYFPDRKAQSLYVDPRQKCDVQLLTQLNLNGFRRSGKLIYRPDCPDCNACQPVRIPVQQFQLSKRFRRILRGARHWQIGIELPSDSLYGDYANYINQRHADGSMYPPNKDQFYEFLVEGHHNHRFLVARENGEFRACLVVDLFLDGLSSVYCFFDPAYEKLSPGSLMILKTTQLAQLLGLPWHYLGYWIAGSRKMEYKQQYQPLEIYKNDQWTQFKSI
ncbi:arginyltransferase [Oceanobacter mangrovi]|uniref:arginyltransferase n=1 Tax=Oceanobacter mangrovi TaxID=2862510 RepID=UPI001C8E63DD|nr:arginyltransferase [Oceanobacter mangrovi]